MLLAAVDRHVLAPFADDLGNRLAAVELASQLIEVPDLEVSAELHGARIGCELAEQYSQQRALTDPVVADDPNAIAAHHPQRKVAAAAFARHSRA